MLAGSRISEVWEPDRAGGGHLEGYLRRCSDGAQVFSYAHSWFEVRVETACILRMSQSRWRCNQRKLKMWMWKVFLRNYLKAAGDKIPDMWGSDFLWMGALISCTVWIASSVVLMRQICKLPLTTCMLMHARTLIRRVILYMLKNPGSGLTAIDFNKIKTDLRKKNPKTASRKCPFVAVWSPSNVRHYLKGVSWGKQNIER